MGHVQDRWYRPKVDPVTQQPVLSDKGKPVREKTELFGKGDRYRVRYLDPTGKERAKSFPDKQKKAADDFLLSVENDKREGRYLDPQGSRTLFRAQAENWLKGQSDDPATREVLRSRLDKRILPTLGDLLVVKIKPSTVRDWMAEIADYSDNYKTVLFTAVNGIMESAVEDRLIHTNPCKASTIRRPTGGAVAVVDVWPESRVKTVRMGIHDRWRIVVTLGAGLGLRQGELLGLSPDDVDRQDMTVHVRRQIRTVDGVKVFAPPKGNKTRTVPISPGLLREIDYHLDDYPAPTITLPWRKPGGGPTAVRLVATGEHGRLYSGDLFTKTVWEAAFREAKIAKRKRVDGMHALRHFYASMLLAQGVSIKELSSYLGHADAGFTLRVYTHMVPSSHDRARLAIDATFARPGAVHGLGTA